MRKQHPAADLIPYLRGSLQGADRERVARHLDDCAECRQTSHSFAELLREIHQVLPPPPPLHAARYDAELRRKLAARRAPLARSLRAWAMPLSIAAVAGVAALLALLFAPPGLEGPPGGPPEEQVASEPASDPVIEKLDLLENLEVIQHLHRISLDVDE
ncbi:MAG: hypothetical protein QOD06_1423 [Candidatus Binatota bacterium]|jgi:anti-sigma factor RsiW|nr:hypothetical protein [Candidatus Binatota bacterium]